MSDQGVVPWLSVITVVKDDPTGFARTIASLREQDLTGVEFTVIDSSSEATPVREQFDSLNFSTNCYQWLAPEGIYLAMNAGLKAATGQYVYYLNAGDTFTLGAVAALRSTIAGRGPVWLLAQVTFVGAGGGEVTPPPIDYEAEKRAWFARGRFPPHQGTVVRRDALTRVGGFDTNYRVAADYAAFLTLSRLADPVECDYVIAEFREGGLSTTSWRAAVGEFHRARRAILQPTGFGRSEELAHTWVHFMRVGLYRVLVAPLRARLRGSS